ncbi:MAG: nucleotidyl transferase AbiEii/AbiGii toxin family protein [Candidatus Magasanikbacteria bacterium]|nr:nucleotidyl transferase AbiEii/AbiGii toxin family protein [Candidatus Magasanikbacteria bacterium]
MLNLEQILNFARERGFPGGREKQAMAEYLQCLILQSFFRHAPIGKISFIGGTSLRFFYNLSRFSEDLDFDNFGLGVSEFEEVIGEVVKDLEAQGFTVDSLIKIKGAFHCYIRFNNLLFANKLSPHASEKILVKIDTTTQSFIFTPEKKFFDRYGIVEEVLVNPKDILAAQKVIALLQRKTAKGRDFFDYTFLHSFAKPNLDYLKQKINIASLPELKEKLLARCAEVNFEEMAKDVAPFLFEARDAIRIIKFKQYIEQWEV